MPYRSSRSTYNRRPRRKYVPRKKPSTWKRLAGAVRPVVRYGPSLLRTVASLVSKVNSELKYVDTSTSGSLTTSGVITCLTNVAEGDTQLNRNGISQLNHSTLNRLKIILNSGASTCTCRSIIFVWNENAQETAPTLAKILEDPTNILSPLDIESSKDYTIIRDKIITLTTGSYPMYYSNKYIKLNPLHSKYSSTTSSSQTSGHIYQLIMSDTVANNPSFILYNRLRYYDN